MIHLKTLSTGQESTFENWIRLAALFYGTDSKAVMFLKDRAAEAEKGYMTEVIADERQLINVLTNIHNGGK